MTFSPHPKTVVCPEQAPEALYSEEEKLELFGQCGAAAVVTVPFTKDFSRLQPRAFLERLFSETTVQIKSICVGEHWRFGVKGAGDTQLLRVFAKERNFDFEAVPELSIDGEVVSSTSIRAAVKAGDMQKARRFLGRPYSLSGIVEHGMRAAGEKLGHPTANLQVKCGVLPPNGVYACSAVLDGSQYRAVCNIGCAPTFDSYGIANLLRAEVHLLDCNMDLYGKKMRLNLLRRIRTERKFESADALKTQIFADVKAAEQILQEEDIKWQTKSTR